ncbi:MAG: hypothetical protein FD170_1728 [Bacteroidetes bacterium]|nr:MAG: hypothetical protein FD170_1728 [Bacteroidota bacterium]
MDELYNTLIDCKLFVLFYKSGYKFIIFAKGIF